MIGSFLSASADEKSPTLIKELWDYFYDKYLSIDFASHDYEHLTPSSSGIFSIPAIIAALLLGVMLAAAVSLYYKRTLGNLVRALDKNGCISPQTAKTLTELHFSKSGIIKYALRRGSALRRVVRCAGEQEHIGAQQSLRDQTQVEQTSDKDRPLKESPYRYDFETDRFYIPQELMFGATTQFDKKGSNPLTFALVVIVCLLLLWACRLFLPELLQVVDNFIGILYGA